MLGFSAAGDDNPRSGERTDGRTDGGKRCDDDGDAGGVLGRHRRRRVVIAAA